MGNELSFSYWRRLGERQFRRVATSRVRYYRLTPQDREKGEWDSAYEKMAANGRLRTECFIKAFTLQPTSVQEAIKQSWRLRAMAERGFAEGWHAASFDMTLEYWRTLDRFEEGVGQPAL